MRETCSGTTMTAWPRLCSVCGHLRLPEGEEATMSATPLLEGTRIRLEPLALSHLAGLEAIAFDDRIWRYMPITMKTPDDLRNWVESALRLTEAGTTVAWATVLKSENRV